MIRSLCPFCQNNLQETDISNSIIMFKKECTECDYKYSLVYNNLTSSFGECYILDSNEGYKFCIMITDNLFVINTSLDPNKTIMSHHSGILTSADLTNYSNIEYVIDVLSKYSKLKTYW